MPSTRLLSALAFAVALTVSGQLAVAGPLPTLYDVVDTCDVDGPAAENGLPQLGIADPTAAIESDDGRSVDIDVLVLLDGVAETQAASIFADVARPYDEINLRVVPTYQVVSPGFVGTDAFDLMDQAKALFADSKVPPGYDMVEVLTSKDVTGGLSPAGTAYCNGGVRDRRYAFEVSEAGAPAPARSAGLPQLLSGGKKAAKVTAHEMGHLFGGQHEYATCGAGVPTNEVLSEAPCTLMFYEASLITLHFGEVNGRIVRGYALRYAAANDG
jgi:hypothetical protein